MIEWFLLVLFFPFVLYEKHKSALAFLSLRQPLFWKRKYRRQLCGTCLPLLNKYFSIHLKWSISRCLRLKKLNVTVMDADMVKRVDAAEWLSAWARRGLLVPTSETEGPTAGRSYRNCICIELYRALGDFRQRWGEEVAERKEQGCKAALRDMQWLLCNLKLRSLFGFARIHSIGGIE